MDPFSLGIKTKTDPQIIMKYGFFFDIDGCLTLPQYNYSVLDKDLIDEIYHLSKKYPVAFVTGRSHSWLASRFEELEITYYKNIPIYLEFGLLHWFDNKIIYNYNDKNFQKIRQHLIETLHHLTSNKGIYFEPEQTYDEYPNHRSLWVENKKIQLSIACNSDISAEKVHRLIKQAWTKYKEKVSIYFHHLGVDVLPHGWSKEKATQHFISNNVKEESEYLWTVFGDNVSDRDMMKGLTHAEFVSTKKGASETVRNFLRNL